MFAKRQSRVSLRRWLPTIRVLLLTMLLACMVSMLFFSSFTILEHNLASANAKLAAANAKLSAIENGAKSPSQKECPPSLSSPSAAKPPRPSKGGEKGGRGGHGGNRSDYDDGFTILEHNLASANAKLAAANAKLSAIENGAKSPSQKSAESDRKAEQLRREINATHRICVVVRTHPGHANVLPITLLSLTQQSYKKADISLSVFVVNTDSKTYWATAFMDEAAADANAKAGSAAVSVLDGAVDGLPPNSKTFGYDVTDRVLEDLLATSSTSNSNCTHFLFTNGDNFYSSSLLKWIAPALKAGKQLIAWDFLTHHKREYNVIKVKFVRKFVDLGAVLVDRRAIEGTGARFLPEGGKTMDLFARDYFFFEALYDEVGEENVELFHQVLLAHQ